MYKRRCLPINSADAMRKFMLVLLYLAGQSSGLRLTSMKVPSVADIREDMEIECHFDMGVEELYAVKWYKDEKEFFRFIPSQDPNRIEFKVVGVQLSPQATNCTYGHCKLKLQNLSRRDSGGAYKCEISSEAPAFRLASETHNVTVAALPKENPKIEGLTASYTEGDIVRARCISDLADPVPVLAWYINGQPAPPSTFGEPTTGPRNTLGQAARTLSLRFPVDKKITKEDRLEIKCEAKLPEVPWPKQVATHTVPIRSGEDPHISNHLQWYIGFNNTPNSKSLHIPWLVLLVVALQWSIWK